MRFDASLRDGWTPTAEGWRFEVPDGWSQGRAVFGGLVAALAAALGRREVAPERRLRTLNIQMLRAVRPGPLEGSVRVYRSGRSVSFVEVVLSQGDASAVVQLTFASPRPSELVVADEGVVGDPEGLPELAFIPGVTPEFIRHVAMRWGTGGFPFSGAAEPKLSGFCRFRVPAGDVEGVIGLLDVWPCPSLTVLKKPAFASTVSWTAHLLHVPDDLSRWCAFEYETVAGAEGYHTAMGRLHDADGRLLGWTEQLVAIFD